MRIVIDANRIIAALVKESTTRDILFDKNFEFLAPDYTITEIHNHEEELRAKTKLNHEEFEVLLSLIFERIKIIPQIEYNEFIETGQLSWAGIKKRLSWSARGPTVWRQPSLWRRRA